MSSDAEGKSIDGRLWRIRDWFPDLEEEVYGRLKAFHYELIHFNGRMNLISPRTERTADMIHFADCILGARAIFEKTDKQEIYDIGSGNGLPGIIMAALAPQRKFHLVDKDARKIEFLKHCIARLGLKNCEAFQTRLEDIPAESIHCAVSRGFASISKTILSARKACANNAEYYHFKGDAWVREVAEIPSQICSFWAPMLVTEYDLPDNGPRLSIVVTKKIG